MNPTLVHSGEKDISWLKKKRKSGCDLDVCSLQKLKDIRDR